ncbi:MAG: TetR/AcrR family transcriptional regulator [Solirubrobacteraceae bacterium]|jgi:AcrR family transcriptional regulator
MSEAPAQAGTDARRPRSDAAANRQRILVAATIAVRRDGETVPMATIADEAGVGIGTLYRHYPTRPALLAALTLRSFQLVLQHARAAALSDESAPAALTQFFEQTIAARDEFVLPLHGGPVIHDEKIVELQAEIRKLLEELLARGRRDGTIRPDITAGEIIITGAMLAQPLLHAADWDQLARRQARIFVAGLAATDPPPAGSRPARGRLKAKSARVADLPS